MTHSPKREKVLFSENFMSFYRPQNIFLDRSFSICPLKNCFFRSRNRLSFYFFWQKIHMQKKVLFLQNFMSLYRPPQKYFWTAVSVFVPWKSAFFVAKTNFLFIFSGIKIHMQKKNAVFAEFYELLSSPNFFWVIF